MPSHKSSAARVMGAFVLHALTVATLISRLPEVQASLGLSEGAFGLALLGTPTGVVTGSLLAARMVDRYGPRRLVIYGMPISGGIAALALWPVNVVMLALMLFAFGLSFASCNVAVNVEADRFEAAEGRRIMSRCHGWWAVGFLVLTLSTAGLIRAGVTPVQQAMTMTLLLAVLAPLIMHGHPVSLPRKKETSGNRRFALPAKSTLLVGGFAFAAIILEGTSRNWAVIYVRDVFGPVEWVAAMALPAFVATQTLGRFAGDTLVERFGDVAVARALSIVLLAGVAVVAFAPGLIVAMVGFALVGLGVSMSLPQALSASARLGDRPAAEGVAAFSTLSTMIAFLGPPLFGLSAQMLGLQAAFALFLPLPLIAIVFARYLTEEAPVARSRKDKTAAG